jgi:hypothetical protein
VNGKGTYPDCRRFESEGIWHPDVVCKVAVDGESGTGGTVWCVCGHVLAERKGKRGRRRGDNSKATRVSEPGNEHVAWRTLEIDSSKFLQVHHFNTTSTLARRTLPKCLIMDASPVLLPLPLHPCPGQQPCRHDHPKAPSFADL